MFPDRTKGFSGVRSFLSNFYPAVIEIEINGEKHQFMYAENAFQISKRPPELITPELIREFKVVRPSKAKELGQSPSPKRRDWDHPGNVKLTIMEQIQMSKFSSLNPNLLQALLDTGDDELIETNYWHDNYWGDCTCTRCSRTPGQNMLGKLLMKVRQIRRAERGVANQDRRVDAVRLA